MKTIINNIYGNIDKYNLQLCKLSLDLENSTEKEALESGWLIDNGIWYQSRSVRIDVSKYNKIPRKIKNHTVSLTDENVNFEEIKLVYDKFIEKKELSSLYNIESDLERSNWLLIRNDNNSLVAFTKFIIYNEGLESQYTALDYSSPKLSIGNKIIDYEVEITINKQLNYLYIGSGYGEISIYKSKIKGFEYWNGEKWTNDTTSYTQLCKNDESIKSLLELGILFNG